MKKRSLLAILVLAVMLLTRYSFAGSKKYEQNARGFYQWVYDNAKTEARREDAKRALHIIENSEWKEKTVHGDVKDATNLSNMYESILLLPILEKVRKNDDNHKNLPPVYYSCEYFSRAQINSNASRYEIRHMTNDKGSPYGVALECLAWGYHRYTEGPFEGWYYKEKEYYDKKVQWYITNYGIDIRDDSKLNEYFELYENDSTFREKSESFGETGHYSIVCTDGATVWNYAGAERDIYVEYFDYVIGGLAVSYADSMYSSCHCLEMEGDFNRNTRGKYTYKEFRELFLKFCASFRNQMYRLYNPNSGEHFYTANTGEKNNLVKLGWKYEGIGWYAPFFSETPVYRLYNENAGDHHYTISVKERDWLVSLGWNYEGIGWYSDDKKGVPLYRQYNPNAISGSHNYTTSKKENDWLVTLGWHAEGIGWYGLK